MIINCRVCGKPFEANNPHYSMCSDECRKAARRAKSKEHSKIYYRTTHGKHMRHSYYRDHYVPVAKCCASCGTALEDGRQSYCLSCLLNDYINNKSPESKQRLYNRGFNSSMIHEELKLRGMI